MDNGTTAAERQRKLDELLWKFERLTPEQQTMVIALADKLRESADRRRA